MKARKNLLKILILLILSGSIINGGYIKKNTIHFTNETVNPQIINSKHHFFYYKLLKLQINAFFRYFPNFSIFPDNNCHNKHPYS